MAKNSASTNRNTDNNDDPFLNMPLPEGGKEVVGDVDGYWDPDKGPIRFMPMSCKAFDNNNDPNRPSILILGKLTYETVLYTTDDDKEKTYQKYPAGASVGVWYKPGMRQIAKHCGVDCALAKSGEKKTGKPNPMITFKLVAGEETHLIPMTEDFRDKSAEFATVFDGPLTDAQRERGLKTEETEEDPGF